MYQEDFWNPADQNDYDDENVDQMYENVKRQDRGYNVIYRNAFRKDGRSYSKKIEVYTSSGTGKRIRDAETGEYLNYTVGSRDEELFFKVMLATGECKSVNGSYALFYTSPQHYGNHHQCKIDEKLVSDWEEKRNARLIEIKRSKNKKFESVKVK